MNRKIDIVKDNHYPAYVLASAGTGKTELIARKVENLIINENVDIDKIALITFTNKATAETLNRIKGKIYAAWQNGKQEIRTQIDKLSMAKISTIHIFCDNIVREYSYEIGLCPNYKISNLTLERDKLVNEIIKENYDDNIFRTMPMYRIARLLKDIEEKASDKGLEVVLKKVKELSFWDSLRNYLAKIYPIYVERLEALKLKYGAITTNDLIRYAVKILQNKKIASYIVSSIEYLFLDEAQDINYDQEHLMELLISYGVKVFVVGDEKQSIYAFRGSDKNAFNNLISFIEKKNGVQYKLETNYRSNAFIIEKVNSLFDNQFKYKKNKLSFVNQKLKPREDAKYDEKSISIVFQQSISDIVNQLLLEGKKLNEITILCRTNKDVMGVYNQLKRDNIPAQSYISKSIYKSKVIIDLIKVFNFVAGGGSLEKAELFYTDLYLASTYYNKSEEDFYFKIENTVISFKEKGMYLSLIQILEESCILRYYSDTDNRQGLSNIQRFIEIIKDLESEGITSMEIINYLNLMVVTGQEENQPQINQSNSVIVSTIHTYKGLDNQAIVAYNIDANLNANHFAEFHYDSVKGLFFNKDLLLPNQEIEKDSQFELSKDEITSVNLEEELRLLYVLMTRAKNRIVLSSEKQLNKMKYRASLDNEYISFLRWIYKF